VVLLVQSFAFGFEQRENVATNPLPPFPHDLPVRCRRFEVHAGVGIGGGGEHGKRGTSDRKKVNVLISL
jgi:hypothetical protein